MVVILVSFVDFSIVQNARDKLNYEMQHSVSRSVSGYKDLKP